MRVGARARLESRTRRGQISRSWRTNERRADSQRVRGLQGDSQQVARLPEPSQTRPTTAKVYFAAALAAASECLPTNELRARKSTTTTRRRPPWSRNGNRLCAHELDDLRPGESDSEAPAWWRRCCCFRFWGRANQIKCQPARAWLARGETRTVPEFVECSSVALWLFV